MKKSVYLQLTPFFPTPQRFNGPFIYDQVKTIERNSQYDVIVIKMVSLFNNEPESYTYKGVKVYNFKVIDLPSSILPSLFHSINLKRFETFLEKKVGILPQQIAFIHAHVAYPAGALAVDFGKRHLIKSFIQHHGLDVMQLNNGRILSGFLKRLNNYFIKKRFLKSVNFTSLNIGVSQKVIDSLHRTKGYSGTKEYILYNGVDPKKFYKKKIKKDPHTFVIGCIANFWPLKDQITLLKALIHLPKDTLEQINVIFIGSGPTLKTCQNFVHQNGLNKYVHFEREVQHDKLNTFYNSIDLFVLPSYYEAFGCVYAEALQVGKPIIGVKGQGIEEVIQKQHKDFFLIPPRDDIELAKKIAFFKSQKLKINYNLSLDKFIMNFIKTIEEL